MAVSAAVPTDPYELLQWNMDLAHETLKRGYDRIASLLSDPPLDDLPNFLGYCEAWAVSIDEHHKSEEEVVFPFLNQKMDFSGEAEEHKVVHSVLEELTKMIATFKANPSMFDAAAMQDLMVRFREPLYTHLDGEVAHISAGNLRTAGWTPDDCRKVVAAIETYARSHGDPFLQVPFMRSHTAAEYKDCWPPMPWLLRKVVVPYVLARRHAGYWKYAPFPMS